MRNLIILILIFAIICFVIAYCLCIASTNWRDPEHDYELDDSEDIADEDSLQLFVDIRYPALKGWISHI